jgi:hypothetical protein
MSYQELTMQRAARLSRRRRSRMHVFGALSLTVYLIIVASIVLISRGLLRSEQVPRLPSSQMVITYGFDRQPATRNFTVNLSTPSTTSLPSTTVSTNSGAPRDAGPPSDAAFIPRDRQAQKSE